ncbi:MAG: DUF3618 domain-containing protein [Kineosporiaceae bacterium]|nr:DUF3618 domain-containing protein [Kineosporiaceae bacterium]
MDQGTQDQLSNDIARRRDDLARDVDALADRVSPSRMVDRRRQAVRDTMHGVRESIMGSAGQARHSMASGGHGLRDSASGVAGETAETLHRTAQGNPLAAGMIAFGAGWLIASIIPSSPQEQQVAQRTLEEVKAHAEPLREEAASAAHEVGGRLGESVRQAGEELQGSARESVQRVREQR